MSKRSKVPVLALLRLTRQIKLMELKYQFAVEDGRALDAEHILAKAARMGERIGKLKALIDHQTKVDQLKEKERNNE